MANKLYPLPSISREIEDFSKEMLLSVANFYNISELKGADRTNAELQKVLSNVILGIPIFLLLYCSLTLKNRKFSSI